MSLSSGADVLIEELKASPGELMVYSQGLNLQPGFRSRDRHRTENKHQRIRKSRVDGKRKSRVTTDRHTRSSTLENAPRSRADISNSYGYALDIPLPKSKHTKRRSKGYSVVEVHTPEKLRKSERRKNRTVIKRTSPSRDTPISEEDFFKRHGYRSDHKLHLLTRSFPSIKEHSSKHSRQLLHLQKNKSCPNIANKVSGIGLNDQEISSQLTWVPKKLLNGRTSRSLWLCQPLSCTSKYSERTNKIRKKLKRRKGGRSGSSKVEPFAQQSRTKWKDGNFKHSRLKVSSKHREGRKSSDINEKLSRSKLAKGKKYQVDVQFIPEMDQKHAHSDDASVRSSTKRKKKKSGRRFHGRRRSKQKVKQEIYKRYNQQQAYSDDESVRMSSHTKKRFVQKHARKKKRSSRIKKKRVDRVIQDHDFKSVKKKQWQKVFKVNDLEGFQKHNQEKFNKSWVGRDRSDEKKQCVEDEGEYFNLFDVEGIHQQPRGIGEQLGEPSIFSATPRGESSSSYNEGWKNQAVIAVEGNAQAGEYMIFGEGDCTQINSIKNIPKAAQIDEWTMSKVNLSEEESAEDLKSRKHSRNEGEIRADISNIVSYNGSPINFVQSSCTPKPGTPRSQRLSNRVNHKEKVDWPIPGEIEYGKLPPKVIRLDADLPATEGTNILNVESVPILNEQFAGDIESDEKRWLESQEDCTPSTSSGISERLIDSNLVDFPNVFGNCELPSYNSYSKVQSHKFSNSSYEQGKHGSRDFEAPSRLKHSGRNLKESRLMAPSSGQIVRKIVALDGDEPNIFIDSLQISRQLEPVSSSRRSTPRSSWSTSHRNDSESGGTRIEYVIRADDSNDIEIVSSKPRQIIIQDSMENNQY